MTKGEFLMTLRKKLAGEIPPQDVERNLQYYDKYITDAVRNGKTEEQVLEELGSPLLIAKTIIDTCGQEERYDSFTEGTDNRNPAREDGSCHRASQSHVYQIPSWLLWLFVSLLIFLAVTILKVLIPILVPVILVGILISWLRKR